MNLWDWAVIVLYIIVIIGIAAIIMRSQRNIHDYYLGGRTITWWQSGLSTMATQLGAISFVSAPAFVALKEGGGLKWLCYEFGVPLALIAVMAIIIPVLHRGNVVSIYEYLEKRFDGTTRSLVAFLFQLGRGLATAVAVLAGGIVLSSALKISTEAAIILVGAATIIYDVLGGIRVVIISDVLQMSIIAVGLIVCGAAALQHIDWHYAWMSLGPERLAILDFEHWGFEKGGEYGFWPMVLGGVFLYASYYGCDQSQVQRELSVRDVEGVRRSLLVNALGRFPIVLLYCVMGVLIGAVITSPEALLRLGEILQTDQMGVTTVLANDPDRMVPLFILAFLPHGVIGFVFVAIMAALMSSLDSALNSLSAVTIRDFYQRYIKPNGSNRHYLAASKICTLFWGIFCVLAALAFVWSAEATRQTTIVMINAVGSMLYGPILAAFLLGMLNKRLTARAVTAGIVLGILSNLALWMGTSVSWLWWNAAGFLVTALVAFTATWVKRKSDSAAKRSVMLGSGERLLSVRWSIIYALLICYFFFLILFCYLLQYAI